MLEVYRNIREQLEDTFENQRGKCHSSPKMERTFHVLARYMQKNNASSIIPGRSAHYAIPDAMAEGMHILMSSDIEAMEGDRDAVNEEGNEEGNEADDEQVVEDRGDLLVE